MPEGHASVMAVGLALREFTEIKAAGMVILQCWRRIDAARQAKLLVRPGHGHPQRPYSGPTGRWRWKAPAPSNIRGCRQIAARSSVSRNLRFGNGRSTRSSLGPSRTTARDGAMTTLVRDRTVVLDIDLNLKSHPLYRANTRRPVGRDGADEGSGRARGQPPARPRLSRRASRPTSKPSGNVPRGSRNSGQPEVRSRAASSGIRTSG